MIIASVYRAVLKLIDIAPVFTKCLETSEEIFRAVSTLQNVSKLFLCKKKKKMYIEIVLRHFAVYLQL